MNIFTRYTRSAMLLACAVVFASATAANTVKTVSQVTESVTISEDVDYTITSATPFATTGSVNITNTDHAVVIFKTIKPSKVISTYLGSVLINGEPADNGTNCQVKMYSHGAIVLPYSKDIRPLTVYDGQNFTGESYDDYKEGHTGGFMNTLTEAKFNNKIRSFKLKRGYMVTFAVGTGGWGYSRCFIADKEDLEVSTLPAILDQRISSYRIFKWQNAKKAGLASDTGYGSTQAVNASWCYSWGTGENRYPDTECVPNHIYEDWPSASACGGVTYSCHMKTNNEPGNSADDHPQDVATVLANWQNLMRTGMRLCSESSHDGSWNHLRAFIDSVDARGWRCDLLDLHCYWNQGAFNGLSNYYNDYGRRPIWISEWVWGASWNAGNWNNGGIFAQAPDGKDSYSQTNQQTCYNGTKPILDVLNANKHVERYAYWNSEANASKIYKDGGLSVLGKYYANMNDDLGYDPSIQKIPNNWRLCDKNGWPLSSTNSKFGDLTATYDKTKGTIKLDWNDPNGDLMQSVAIQCKAPGSISWTDIESITPKDQSSAKGASYSHTVIVDEPGAFTYRIKAVPYNSTTTKYYTEEVTVNVAPSQGTDEVQFGKLSIDNTNVNRVDFSESFEAVPCVFTGAITNTNSAFRAGSNCSNIQKGYFEYQLLPWLSNTSTISKNEEVPFLAMKKGNYKYGNLDCEVNSVMSPISGKITFNTPFPEGVTPIVIAEIAKPGYSKYTTLSLRISNITNTGFDYIILPEEKCERNITLQQTVSYLAITPGFAYMDEENNILIAAGKGTNQIYSGTMKDCMFTVDQVNTETGEIEATQLKLKSPTIITQLQTNNYPASMMLRRTDIKENDDMGTWITGVKVKRLMDRTFVDNGQSILNTTSDEKYRDEAGWVAVSIRTKGGSEPTAIEKIKYSEASNFTLTPRVVGRVIYVDGVSSFDVYNISGIKLPSKTVLTPGIYMVKSGNRMTKVQVK